MKRKRILHWSLKDAIILYFPLFTGSVRIKVNYSSNFYEFRKRSSDIAYFVKHPVYSILKMYSLLILVFLFWFTTIHLRWFTQRECVKVTFFEIPGAPRKNHCYCIFPGAPYIAILKCLVSWHQGFYYDLISRSNLYAAISKSIDFDFPLFTQNASITVIYSWNFRCCPKEAVI